MNNKRATKRALLTSVMALVMCVVMLAGTTFAWFTDTASTGVNKIQAGNLDVALEYATKWDNDGKVTKWENAEGKTLQFKTADGRTDNILWEPGCRYQLPELRVVNKGNLALKYIIKVTGIETNHEVVPGEPNLNDVITWEIKYSDDAVWNAEADTFKAGYSLAPNASNVVTIKGEMDKNAGNKYQGLSIDGVSVTVYATQMTAEFDSIDNKYDKDAAYKGSQEFTSGTHVLNKGGVALNPNDVAVLVSGAGTDVTITGGYYDGGSGGDNICVWAKDGAKVTIKGGTFTVGGDANGAGNSVIYSTGGDITIEGGFFQTDYSWNGKYYVLNQNNSNPGTITVKGGTFVNYDPSKGDDNLGGTFVASGYSVISEKHGEDTWYTVVKGTGVTAGTQEALKDALTRADTTGSNALTVKLADGEYTLYNVDRAKTQNTELTIEGAGKDKTVFTAGDMTVTDANGEGSSDYSYEGSDVTFKNMTVNVGTGNYKGFVRAKSLYFENCTIEGRGSYWGIGSVVFKDCIFNSVNDYNIWTYAGMDFTFDNCTFNSDAGKFVNAYKEEATGTTKLTFTDCKFVAGTENKPAVCLKGYKSNAWDVTFSGCSLTNCKTDVATGSNYYLLDQGIENATTVTIDGKVVWENGAKK